MIKLSYNEVKQGAEKQFSFLERNFRQTLFDRVGIRQLPFAQNWFMGLNVHDRDQLVKDCIDQYNALSPGAPEEDTENPENLNKALLEAFRYQNKLISSIDR